MIDSFPNQEITPKPPELIPTAEEVREVFKRLIGKEFKETKKVEDDLGLYILEVETPGAAAGDTEEYGYRRKKTFAEGEPSKTEIAVTYYSDGMPISGQDVAKYIDSRWVISIEIYPGASLETIKALSLSEISSDLHRATAEHRKVIFERLATERDEKWVSEALEINQPFSIEEQELLVGIISDPYLSFEVLTLDVTTGEKLTTEQKEKLMTQIEEDEDVAQSFYLQLVESGVAEEPTETEKWWIVCLEKVLAQTDNPEIASYALEHNKSLTEENRGRLEKVINP